jgi:hypothetical protein
MAALDDVRNCGRDEDRDPRDYFTISMSGRSHFFSKNAFSGP